jgi:flagellin
MAGIITNYLSLVAQNNLEKSKDALGTAIERLSSGYRINNAKDDAAGQAIANRFTANIRGLTQAARNANDGISLTQTTEGAITEINNNLQRIRELTVQALNGSNSASDLNSIQSEIDQRTQEINRVSAQTQFNGVNVLAQENSLSLQVGANDDEVITVDLERINAVTLGINNFKVNGDQLATAGDLITKLGASGFDIYNANVVSGATTVTGPVTVDVNSGQVLIGGSTTAVYFDSKTGGLTTATSRNQNSTYLAAAGTTSPGDALAGAIATAGAGQAAGGVIAVKGLLLTVGAGVDASGNGTYTASINGVTTTFTIAGAAATNAATTLTATNAVYNDNNSLGNFTLDPATTPNRAATGMDLSRVGVKTGSQLSVTSTVVTGTYLVDSAGKVTLSGSTAANPLEPIYLSSAGGVFTLRGQAYVTAAGTANSIDPLATLDNAISTVDTIRGALGAAQNRLESTIANLNNTLINIQDARSRIEDADYAVEVSNMGKNQILQQAGTAVLAQANQVPQTVLALLR